MRAIAAMVLVAAAAWAQDGGDPEGTAQLRLEVGQRSPLESPPGTNVICDDPRVAVGEFADDGEHLVIRAVKVGTTLCGVWLGEQKPGGLYRVTVTAADAGQPAPSSKPDAGTAAKKRDGGS